MRFEKSTFTNLTGEAGHTFINIDDKSLAPFMVTATRANVSFTGDLKIESEGDLAVFAKTLSDAWKIHRQLQPKISTTLAGH